MVPPVYLFTGPEIGERNDEIRKIKAELKKKFGNYDDFFYYFSDTRIQDVVSQLQNVSLFTPAVCIVLRGVELLKGKSEIEILLSWITSFSSPSKNNESMDSSVLILVSDEISVDSKLEKIIPKQHRRIFWEMFENHKETWLLNFFQKNGFFLEPDAAELILDLVENNTEQLRSECSRFFLCFESGATITESDVQKVLTRNRVETPFTLFDAMANSSQSPSKRLENSASVLEQILASKNANSVMVIAALSSCFRRLLNWHQIHSNTDFPDEQLLRISGFASKTARAQYASASLLWGSGECAAITALLAHTDIVIRSMGASLAQNQLFLMLYEIVMRKGSYCSEYILS